MAETLNEQRYQTKNIKNTDAQEGHSQSTIKRSKFLWKKNSIRWKSKDKNIEVNTFRSWKEKQHEGAEIDLERKNKNKKLRSQTTRARIKEANAKKSI